MRPGETVVKEYKIALGSNPIGHKEQEGDGKTPEGQYIISDRNPKSAYHLSLRISYPDEKDKIATARKGISSGGDIMIHGFPNKVPHILFRVVHSYSDWTAGCIAVTDEEIWILVQDNTPITIKP